MLLSTGALTIDLSQLQPAQQQHDVLVQMVTDTTQTGTQSQAVQRIQVVDQDNNNAILAFGDLSTISNVSIVGGTGNNNITIDADSFGAQAVPAMSVTGGSGQNALIIDHNSAPGATPETWQLTGANSGQASGPATVAFSNIQSLVGGAGTDILQGPTSNTSWNVTGPGSGTVAGTSFSGFENLQGAANNDDTFVFAPGGSMSGGIDGGAGGFDTLVMDGNFNSVAMAATNGNAGSVTLDGNTIDYAGLEPITLDGTANNLVIDLPTTNTSGGADTVSLAAGATAGQLTLSSAGGDFETTSFDVPTQSLAIDLGGDADTINVQSLDPSFAAGLTIDSGDSAATGTVELASNISTGGNALSITASTIIVDSGVTINTQASGADSGAISLTGRNITLSSGSDLDAAANDPGHSAGDVSLTVDDEGYRIFDLPVDFVSKSVGISLEGASIQGGDVSLSATATDLSLAGEVPSWAAGFTSTLSGLFAQIPGAVISGATGIDASVILRGADAGITVDNSSIAAAGDVSIASTTDVQTTVTATALGVTTSPQVAVGYAQATSTVTAIVSGTSTITALHNVTVKATGETDSTTNAYANANTFSSNSNATGFAIALADTDLTDTAEVDSGATITATLGDVNIQANGTDKVSTNGATDSAQNAKAGVSVGIGFDLATVQSLLNGHITAGGTVSGGTNQDTFNPQQSGVVDQTTGTIYLPDHGLKTGQAVTYTAGDQEAGGITGISSDIGGLTSGNTYYVIVVDQDHIQLADRPALTLDPAGTDPNATQTLSVPTADTFTLDAIDSGQNTISIDGNGFNDGDLVTYHANGNTAIQGLTDGATYMVQMVDSSAFQLLNTTTNAVETISQGSALGTQTFFDTTTQTSATLTLASIDPNADTITLPDNGLTNGETVYYSSLEPDGSGVIGSLQNTAAYTVQLISPSVFQLVDPSTGQVVALSDPGATSLQQLAFIGETLGFNPTTAVDGDAGTIDLPANDLTTGEAVVYRTDPTLTHTTTAQAENADGTRGTPLTIDANDTPIGGLQNNKVYYVVKVDADHIRLADNPADALAALPVTFTSSGSGNSHTVAPSSTINGIGVSAALSASDVAVAAPQTGGSPSDFSDPFKGGNASVAGLLGSASALFSSPGAEDENGTNVDSSVQNDGFAGAGGIALNIVTHHVYASVGNEATAQNPTVLVTPADIQVSAAISESAQINATAGVSDVKGSAAAVAIGVGVYTNDAEATIYGHTQVDAGGTLSVASSVTYPLLVDPAQLFTQLPGNIESNGLSGLSGYLDGTLGIASNLLNTWVVTDAGAGEGDTVSISGSIAVNVYNNTSLATIEGGAQINQNAAYQNANQSVAVDATTQMTMLNVAGIGSFALNLGGLTDAIGTVKKEGLGAAVSGGDLVSFGGSAGGKALGGSILVSALTDDTEAIISAGVALHIGASGSLALDAEENILRVEVSQSGSTQSGAEGSLAFAGSGIGYRQRSTTYAGIETSDGSGAMVTGGGDVTITAHTGGTQVGVAGSIVRGNNSTTGVGVSVDVNDIVRNTDAFIGADPSENPEATPAAATSLDVGTVAISATTDGTILGVAVAGTVSTAQSQKQEEPQSVGESDDDPLDGISLPALFNEESSTGDATSSTGSTTSGVGVAGSAVVNVISDTTYAYVDAAGTLTADTLSVVATNDQTIVDASGGVAITANSKSTNGAKDIAGAFGLNELTADTRAFMDGISLDSTALAQTGVDQVLIQATRSGNVISASAALAADTTATGKDFAGSVSINRVIDTTEALIDSAAITQASNVGVKAEDEAQIIAVGGGLSVTKGNLGVGASIGFNQIAADTEAAITGNHARSELTLGGNLTVDAENDNIVSAIGVSGGVATGEDSNAAAFTIGINIISSSPSIFDSGNGAAIVAEIENADVTTGGNVSVTADDNSVIQSIAGEFAVGTQGNAFGASLSWNQVDLNIRADIDNAVVHATGSISLTGESTEDAGLVDGKIASIAVGGGGGSKTAFNASISVNGVIDTIEAKIEDGATVTAGGPVTVAASDNSTIYAINGAVAISTGGSGFGAAIGANYIDNSVTASIDTATVNSTGGDVSVNATESGDIEALSVGLEGADQNAAGGSISIAVITDTVVASIAGAATVTANGSVRVKGKNDATVGAVSGQVAIGLGGTGFGASVTTAVVVNSNSAFISGDADVSGTQGVDVDANTDQNLTVFAIGGAVGSENGIAGSATVTVVNDTTLSYIDSPDSSALADAGVSAGTGSGTAGDVQITAENTFNLLGTAGALTFGGDAGVGVGADAGVVTRTTKAYIGNNAKVTADGSVIVEASATEGVDSFSIAGAGGGDVAVGLTAGVSVMNLTALAYIDSDATVIARDNVIVSAADQTGVTLVSGNITGAGDVAVGIGAGISVLNKDTEAYIASDATVTAQALGTATTVNSGSFGAPSSNNTQSDNVNFTTSSVNFGNDEITANGHGLQTGDEVTYSGANDPLGGLDDGGLYYVIRVDANHFELARSYSDALAGNAIDLSQGLAGSGDSQTVERLTGVSAPNISTDNFSASNLGASTQGAPTTTSRRGVAVVSVSTNTLQNAGAAGGGSGSVAVEVAGAVAVDTINTLAYIGAGAKIDQQSDSGASAAQSVSVDAGRSYQDLSLGIAAAFSGAVGVAPEVAVPVLDGTTAARILGNSSSGDQTIVNANQDVEVVALAQADFVAIAAGAAISGTASIAGSGAAVVVNTTTEAAINGFVTVAAGGNVLVAATDNSTVDDIAGAIGIGFTGGGGAGAVAVALIGKTTDAVIENHAQVDADGNGPNLINGVATGGVNGSNYQLQSIRGVAVQAFSSENITSVAGSGAGGLYVGVAGGVTVEETNSNTFAAIENSAQVDENDSGSANTQQSVAVGASNTLNITAVAGALGIGAAGVGAGVDVEVIRNNTEAFIASAEVRAAGAVAVDAVSVQTINSNAIAVGAGLFGLGGGISVLSIGGGFNASYSGSGQALGSGSGNDDVLSSVDSTLSSSLDGIEQSGSGGLPAINPSTQVNNTDHTVDFGAADNLHTGDAVVYSSGGGAPIDGLQDGQTYFVITDGSDNIQLAATRDDALAGNAIAITSNGATGTDHQFSASGTDIGNAARASTSSDLPGNSAVTDGTGAPSGTLPSGTTAAIAGSAVTAGAVGIAATQHLDITDNAGGGGVGAVAIGVGVAVITIDANVDAYVGPDTTIDGLGGAGSLTVDATRSATVTVLGISGDASGFVSLGAAVAVVTDNSNVEAVLGATITDGGIDQPSAASDGTEVGGSGFGLVRVEAQDTENFYLATGAANISAIAGLGAAITSANVGGTTEALIGNYAVLGSSATSVGAVTVEAQRTVNVEPHDDGGPFAIGISGGLGLGGAAGAGLVDIGGTVAAEVGDNALIESSLDVLIEAIDSATVNIALEGGGIGALAVGAMIATITMEATVEAAVGSAEINAKDITVEASSTPSVTVSASPLAGGILASGAGASATVTMTPTVSASIADGASLVATGDVTISSTSTNYISATASGDSFSGGVAVGISEADVTLTNNNSATVGTAAITAGDSFSLLANTINTVGASATGSSGSTIDIAQSSTSVTIDDTTSTSVGLGGSAADHAAIIALNALDVEARMATTVLPQGPGADTGGLGVNVSTTGDVTVTADTTTEIGTYASLQGNTTQILARVTSLNLQSNASADADALGASTNANANLTTTSTVAVNLDAHSLVIGESELDIKARQESLQTSAYAESSTSGLGGDTSPSANNTLTTYTDVNADATAEADAHVLFVEAYADPNAGFSANTDRSAAVIDTGGSSSHQTITFDRDINWNAGIVVLPAPDPTLIVAANGAISGNIAATQNANHTVITVPNISNSGGVAGSVTFSIADSYLDHNPGNVGTVNAEAKLTGAPSVTFQTSYRHVTITNASGETLDIGNINPVNPGASFATNVTIHVGDQPSFSPTVTTQTGATVIDIANTNPDNNAGGDIVLNGVIANTVAGSTTTIGADTGSIVNGTPIASIATGALTLSTPGGHIGTSASPLQITSTLFTATAAGDIDVVEQGDLTLGGVVSTAGTVNLAAQGSILDGLAGIGTDIIASNIVLTANGGSIGTASSALTIGTPSSASATSLSATAHSGINIFGNAVAHQPATLNLNSAISVAGDITIETTDAFQAVDDIVLGANSQVRASGGNVTLEAGDNFIAAQGSVIAAQGAVVIAGDFSTAAIDPDPGSGATISLSGTITGQLAVISGGGNADTISLTGVATGTPTTINTGGGSDVIRIGSKATSTSDTGGVLATIGAALTITGANAGETVELDDTGDTLNASGTLTASALTGFGMAGSIQYSGIANLDINLGSGKDSFNVQGTAAATTTQVVLGGGASTVTVGGAGGTVQAVAGLLELTGDSQNDTLSLDDSAATTATTGILTANRLTGLGMGSGDPTVVNDAAGILYNGFSNLGIVLGSGVDTFTVSGTAGGTATALATGGGADNVTVGTDLSQIDGSLFVAEGGDSNDSLLVQSNLASNLTLSRQGAVGEITGTGINGQIYYGGVGALTVTQNSASDKLDIQGTTTGLTVNTGATSAQVTVDDVENQTTINLGAGTNTVTVHNADAALTIDGDAGNTPTADTATNDALTLDLSATTAALTSAIVEDGSAAGIGVLHLFTAGDITFAAMQQVNVNLGSGNDQVEIKTTTDILNATTLSVNGGAGDDSFTVDSIGGPATNISGGAGNDTATLVIPAFPTLNEFATLNLDVETLVVDNSQNTTSAVAWTELDGQTLQAATSPQAAPFTVVNTAGALHTRILGGALSDTLNVESDVTTDINGTITGDDVVLESGLDVLSENSSGTYLDQQGAMSFDGLQDGVSSSYGEDGLTLSSNGLLQRSDAGSPAAQASSTNDQFTLSAGGDPFSLYAMSFAAVGSTSTTFTITGHLASAGTAGGTVTKQVTVSGNTFTPVTFDSSWTWLTSVTFTPGVNVLLDNVTATADATSVAAPTVAAATVPTFTISSNVTFNTSTGTLASGSIAVNYNDGTSTTIVAGQTFSGRDFSETTIDSGTVAQFIFEGDLVIGDTAGNAVTISAIASNSNLNRGLSLSVADDFHAYSNVEFNFSANGTQGGAGGGGGGGAGQGGTAGYSGTYASGGQNGQNGEDGSSGDSGHGGLGRAGGGGGGGGGGAGGNEFFEGDSHGNGGNGGGGGTGYSGQGGINGTSGSGGINGGAGGGHGYGGSAGTTHRTYTGYFYFLGIRSPAFRMNTYNFYGYGGGGGSGGTGDAQAGYNGGSGAHGGNGGTGTGGSSGNNSGSGLTISGGGAGGGGGGGGGGGRGGGGGGGGGGAGQDGSGGFGSSHGAWDGGAGGNGGTGAHGSAGTPGGGGGGAFEIVAHGSVTVGSSGSGGFFAQGAAAQGAGGTNPGQQGGAGQPGGSGGGDTSGGSGGTGGSGGSGGAGGTGGAGAGGTIKLYGTYLNTSGAIVKTSGGAGNNGRVILGSNVSLGTSNGSLTIQGSQTPGNITGAATISDFAGPQASNSFIAPRQNGASTATDYIDGLAGGADIAGLINSSALADLFSSPPSGALVGVTLVDPSSYTDAYTGYDLLVIDNVSSINLENPTLGIVTSDAVSGNTGYTHGLTTGGVAGEQTLSALAPGQIWVTLVPTTTTFGVNLSVNGSIGALSATNSSGQLVAFVLNQVSYVTAQAPNQTVPTNVAGLGATAISPDGNQLYAVDTAQNALVVINTSDLSQRQFLQNGANNGISPVISGMSAPTSVAVSADGQSVYVASNTSNQIVVFTRDAHGNLAYQETVSSSAGTINSLSVSSDNAYVIAGGSNGIDMLRRSISSDPVQTGTFPFLTNLPTGELRDSFVSAIGNVSAVAQSGNALYAVGNGSLYQINAVEAFAEEFLEGQWYSAGLQSGPGVTGSQPVAGAKGLAVYSSGGTDYIYVTAINGNISTISAFTAANSGLGVGNLAAGTTLQDGQNGVRGMASPSGVTVSSDGRFVMVTGQSVNGVAIFSRDATTGALQFAQVLRNNVGGTTGLANPDAIVTIGNTAYITSGGATGVLGGIASFNIAATVPAPIADDTSFTGIENLAVTTGSGDDTISLVAAPDPTVATTTISTGAGDDNVVLQALSAATNVYLGPGDDQADLRATTANASVTIDGNDPSSLDQNGNDLGTDNDGNDSIRLDRAGANDTITVNGDAGNDTVYVNGAAIPASDTVHLHGNNPTTAPGDTLLFDPSGNNFTPTNVNPSQGTIQAVTGVGNTPVGAVINYDTFEGVTVVHAPVITLGTFSGVEGQSVTLTANFSSPGNPLTGPLQWDIEGNGSFGEVTSPASSPSSITLTYQQLVDFGLGDGGTYQIGVKATNAVGASEAFTTLTIADVAPTVTVTGASSTLAGTPYQVAFSASDPDNDRITQWTVNWGDGETDTYGAGTANATHTFANPGTEKVVVGALDDELTSQVFSAPLTVSVGVNSSQVSAGGPYTIAAGNALSLAATAVGTPVSYAWNINGSGFTDATGQTPTLTWAQLEALPVHPVQDAGTFSVQLQATYAGGLVVTSAATTLSVTDTAPTATLTNSGPVNEGSTATVTFANPTDVSQGEVNAGFTYSYDFNNDGKIDLVTTSAVATVPAQYLMLPGADTVRGVITDKDGSSTTLFTTITVNEVPPTLVVTGAPSVTEGQPYQLNLSATDPGAETIQTWVVDWNGDGSDVQTVNGATQSLTHVYGDDVAHTIGITAVDPYGTFTASKAIAVTNATPQIQSLAATPTSEGSATDLTGAIVDPSTTDTYVLSVVWGDGTNSAYNLTANGKAFDVTHVYGESPASGNYAVTATVTDNEGANSSATTNAAVADVPPTIGSFAASAPTTPEGSTISVTGAFADPGALDTQSVMITWGDGTKSAATVDETTHLFTAAHQYLDESGAAGYAVVATLTNSDNLTATASTDINVTNVKPLITQLNLSDQTPVEGETLTLNGAFFDPGTQDGHSALINWGDGTTSLATLDNQTQTFVATHQYLDANYNGQQGAFKITTTVSDDDGASDTVTNPLTVVNVAPVITSLTTPPEVNEGDTVNLAATFFDPGTLDAHTAVIAWGDGTTSVATLDNQTQTFAATHQYLDANYNGQ
ncbi:MAG TPA: PKD domain-containing protein, partial [Stellaceae bacterium]